MQRAGFTTLLGIVAQPYDTSFSNINAKPEKFFKLRSIFQTNLFSNVRSFKIGHIRNVSSYDSRDSKITLKRRQVAERNWRAVNVQELKSQGARPMKNARDLGRYTVVTIEREVA